MNNVAVGIGQFFDSPIGDTIGIADLVSILLSNAVTFAGLILLFFIVGGGFLMITGAGQNDPQKLGKGRQAVTAAVLGFAIIFVAYWIIRIIETITGLNILSPTP